MLYSFHCNIYGEISAKAGLESKYILAVKDSKTYRRPISNADRTCFELTFEGIQKLVLPCIYPFTKVAVIFWFRTLSFAWLTLPKLFDIVGEHGTNPVRLLFGE